jgi:hypothetical protein
VKNKLYKQWIKTRITADEIAYKNYKAVFRKVVLKAETDNYHEVFDKTTISVRKLWDNLNTICSFRNISITCNSINLIKINYKLIIDRVEFCNELNDNFCNCW